MLWTDSFTSRVLFNASKAYVRQLEKGTEYKGLQPVYALSLVNEIFENDFPEFYHHYRIVHVGDSTKTIDGLQLIFVELPKFDVKTIAHKKLTILWLRFLSEIENGKEMEDQDLLNELANVPEIAEAYDKYWDQIRTERTLIVDAETRGLQQGREEGEQIGIQKGKIEVVLKSYESGISISLISNITDLPEDEVKKILKDHGKLI